MSTKLTNPVKYLYILFFLMGAPIIITGHFGNINKTIFIKDSKYVQCVNDQCNNTDTNKVQNVKWQNV